MADYIVHRTDTTAPSVTVPEKRVNTTSLDVALAGKIRLEYGEALDEALLNVLENFACPELEGSNPVVPDLLETSKGQLQHPTIGQFWYNSTRGSIFYWTGTQWQNIPQREGYAANWGQIMHGQNIPRPVAAETGYVFPYEDCIFSVAPAVILGKISYLNCSSSSDGLVTMEYRYSATNETIFGQANYLIVGINGNASRGPDQTPPAPSPTPSVTMTSTPGASVTPSPTAPVTPTPTPTISVTPSPTPAVSPTPSVTVSATVTPTPVATTTPTVTPAATITPTPTPTSSPAPVPIWVMIEESCYTYSGEVVYGCPEPPSNGDSCLMSELGTTTMSISDCGVGPNETSRCTRLFECRLV